MSTCPYCHLQAGRGVCRHCGTSWVDAAPLRRFSTNETASKATRMTSRGGSHSRFREKAKVPA